MALCGGTGEDDQRDAEELHGCRVLSQHQKTQQHADGGLEGHQGAEGGRCRMDEHVSGEQAAGDPDVRTEPSQTPGQVV